MTRRAPSRTPVIAGLLLGVMVVAAAGVFFLMPRTGTLVVNVADTKGGAVDKLEVWVDGTKRCDSAPCIVPNAQTGIHQVKVVAKGFEPPAPRAVTVDGIRDMPTDFQLVPLPATSSTGLKVAASGSGVRLHVDGKDVGPLPQELRELEPGEHTLRFVGDRYAPLERTVTLTKDEMLDLGTMPLTVLKGKATIQLSTPGARVYLVNGTNRKEVPQLPMAIEFDANEVWDLQATKAGFEEYWERISFEDGQAEKTFTVMLSPKTAAAPRPTPLRIPPAAPAPRDLAVTQPKPLVEAATGDAALKINSLPASSIVLDGRPIGVTPQLNVPVAPGTHTITFVNAEQSLKKTITVEVKPGETKAAFAKLRDE